MTPLTIGIVIPWYGEQCRGGAESAARELAENLAQHGHNVEVLTTTCESFLKDWSENHLPVGITEDNKVKVRRFSVEKRDSTAFDQANSYLLGMDYKLIPRGRFLMDDHVGTFLDQGINSPALIEFIRQEAQRFDGLFFLPYCFGLLVKAATVAPEKSYLWPCLHDETYARLSPVAEAFLTVNGICYNSEGERELAETLYGPGVRDRGHFVGLGIDQASLKSVEPKQGVVEDLEGKDFILCLGRRDPLKGCDRLRDGFTQANTGSTYLVFAGPGDAQYNDASQNILDLGLVSFETKVWLLRNSRCLINPSPNESYSKVLMESWISGSPVVVAGDCLATRVAVEQSGGGLIAEAQNGWAEAIETLIRADSEKLTAWADNGRAYAERYGDWNAVIERVENLLRPTTEAVSMPPVSNARRVVQILTGFDNGDAISEEARLIDGCLKQAGVESHIMAKYIHEDLADQARQLDGNFVKASDFVLYHHSIGDETGAIACAHQGPKALIYHNITPPHFFREHFPEIAGHLEEGIRQLPEVTASFDTIFADSQFNITDLEAAVGKKVNGTVLPLMVPSCKWRQLPEQAMIEELRYFDTINLMFVGRIAPNKRQLQLVDLAANLLKMGVNIRFLMMGQIRAGDPYAVTVQQRMHDLGVYDRFVMPGKITQAELLAAYMSADIFVSLSEHEGFCVPLIEAMNFDIPIVALGSSAIPETLAGCGIEFNDASDLVETAALVKAVIDDPSIQRKVVRAQRQRRGDFSRSSVESALRDLLIPKVQSSQ